MRVGEAGRCLRDGPHPDPLPRAGEIAAAISLLTCCPGTEFLGRETGNAPETFSLRQASRCGPSRAVALRRGFCALRRKPLLKRSWGF